MHLTLDSWGQGCRCGKLAWLARGFWELNPRSSLDAGVAIAIFSQAQEAELSVSPENHVLCKKRCSVLTEVCSSAPGTILVFFFVQIQ